MNVSLMLMFGLLEIVCSANSLHRSKRNLVFPNGGTFKLVIGVAIPVKVGPMQTMAVGWNLQYQYAAPTNITQLQNYPPVVSRSDRDKRQTQESDRALFYRGVEDALENQGINGKACILRSICENAADTTFHDANGLYGQLIHIALTPDYGDGEVDPDLNPIYFEAQQAGKYGAECETLYSDCNYENGLLDLFSVVEDELMKYTQFK